MLIFDNKNILTCYIYLQKQFVCFYYISWKFTITLCVGITFRNDFLLDFAHLVLLHFVKSLYYIMRRYYISQRFCIIFCVGITFRNVYYIMRFNRRAVVYYSRATQAFSAGIRCQQCKYIHDFLRDNESLLNIAEIGLFIQNAFPLFFTLGILISPESCCRFLQMFNY